MANLKSATVAARGSLFFSGSCCSSVFPLKSSSSPFLLFASSTWSLLCFTTRGGTVPVPAFFATFLLGACFATAAQLFIAHQHQHHTQMRCRTSHRFPPF